MKRYLDIKRFMALATSFIMTIASINIKSIEIMATPLEMEINEVEELIEEVIDIELEEKMLEELLMLEDVLEEEQVSDITNHWAEEVITEWIELELLSGFPDGTVRPNDTITRAQFVTMLQNVFILRATAPAEFSDVKPTSWYYDAVAAAYSSGIASGMEDGTFRPDDNVTRAQAAVFGSKVVDITGGTTSHYTDEDSIPTWAVDSIGGMSDKGYLSGMPDGSFAPNEFLTRAQAVSFLDRIVKDMEEDIAVSTESTTEYTYVIEEKGTVISNQEFHGNLIISRALGSGKVTLNNVILNGNLIVQGGGSNEGDVLIKNTEITGTIIMDQEDVSIEFSGETTANNIQINKICTIDSNKDFKGDVGKIYFPYEIDTKQRTKINMSVEQIIANNTVYVELGNFVNRVSFGKNAGNSKFNLTKDGIVNTLVCNSVVTLTGSGEIRVLQANTNGITAASALAIKNTELGSGVEKVAMVLSSASGINSSTYINASKPVYNFD